MRTQILTGQIKPPMIFFAPESSGGGGGGAAVAEPDEIASDPGNADVVGFTPSGLDTVDFGEGPAKPAEEPEKPATPDKPPVDKAPATPPAKKEAAKPEGEPVGAKLRDAYNETKRELAEAREKLEKGDPRIGELEKERDAAKLEITTYQKRIEERDARDMENSPEVLKPLKDFDAAFDEKADRFYASMENLDHKDVVQLMPKWFALKKGDPDYQAKRADFDAALNKALGAEEGDRHPSYERALDWILQCQGDSKARNALVEDIKKNAATRFSEHTAKTYTEKKSATARAIEAAKKVPDGLPETHPKVVISKVLSALEPKQVAAIENGIAPYIERIQLASVRRPDSDYPGMSPEQIKEARADEAEKTAKATELLPDALWNGLIAMRVLPALLRDNAKLRERLGEKQAGEPPDPGGDGKGTKDLGEVDPLTGFKPGSTDIYDKI